MDQIVGIRSKKHRKENAMEKYKYNEETYQWERIDREQTYKGVKIQTITYHADGYGQKNHREYRVTWLDGRESWFGINKRGGNIKELKEYIDFKTK